MFERLNNGGIALSAQEVRACIYRGYFSDFIQELSTNDNYNSILKLQLKKENDGTSEEVILKFFAYLFYRSNFKGNVKGFLNEYMEQVNNNFDDKAWKTLFENVVSIIRENTQGSFLRSGVNVTPLNQLEAVMVGLGELLSNNSPISKPPENWLNDDQLIKFSTGATNTRNMLEKRIDRAKELFSN